MLVLGVVCVCIYACWFIYVCFSVYSGLRIDKIVIVYVPRSVVCLHIMLFVLLRYVYSMSFLI